MIISAAGREYRSRVESLFRVDGGEIRQPYFGPIGLDIEVRPPDNRRRDLDNVLKAMLDSLAAAGFYADDSQVCSIRITRGPSYTPDGFCVVRIAHLDAEVH
jgi:crossover junction endodeoxyribonuclease RusA